jgi:hypothetical protein
MAGRLREGDPGYAEFRAAYEALSDIYYLCQSEGDLYYLTEEEQVAIRQQIELISEFLREFDLLFAGWVIGRKSGV